MTFDFDYRPENYFDEAVNALLATIKGEHRKQTVIELIGRGDVEALEDWMITAELSGEQREALSNIHPALMGGEYLPNFLPGEVEIARISLRSTTGDVIGVWARHEGETFQYRIVDEYETEFNVRPQESTEPLTLGELIDMLDFARGDGTESFVHRLRRGADPDGTLPEEALRFVIVTSEFYPDLRTYYEQDALEYLQRRKTERSMKYGLHKIIGGISVARALNIFEFACNKTDTLFITESWFTPRRNRMRELLADPITNEQAEALIDSVMKRQRLDDVIEWLRDHQEMSWQYFVDERARQAAQADAAGRDERRRNFESWLDRMNRARPTCPRCGTGDQVIPVVGGYGDVSDPPANGRYIRIGFGFREPWYCKRCSQFVKDSGQLSNKAAIERNEPLRYLNTQYDASQGKAENVRFVEVMAARISKMAVPTIDDLLETLDILGVAIDQPDKEKAFEAITILLLQCLKFFGPDREGFDKISPSLEQTKDAIQRQEYETAQAYVLALTRLFQSAKEELESS